MDDKLLDRYRAANHTEPVVMAGASGNLLSACLNLGQGERRRVAARRKF